MKKQEGVTLIALAVTIIVMLILAGVSISTLTGNSGISKNAENARLQNELGSIIEKINLAISESFMNDVNVDKMKVLIDKGYIIENKDKNYDYVDASTVLGSSSKFGKGNEDKERYILDGNKVVYINNKGEEVTEMWYEKRMAPEGVGVVNPAFDVTDHSLVTGIITEKGIAYEPFKESFEKMGIKPVEKYVDKK